MKVKVELEMEVDLKQINLTELRKLIQQVVNTEESKVVKKTRVVNFEIV